MTFPLARTLLSARIAVAAARPMAMTRRTFSQGPRANEIIKRYTSDHEWITIDTDDASNTATIGITAYAAASLGDVVYVELPQLATAVAPGDVFGAVESVKSASDLLSPVAGEVVAANDALDASPGLINRAPEGDGWVAKVRVAGGAAEVMDTEGLLEKAEYDTLTKG